MCENGTISAELVEDSDVETELATELATELEVQLTTELPETELETTIDDTEPSVIDTEPTTDLISTIPFTTPAPQTTITISSNEVILVNNKLKILIFIYLHCI